MRRHFLFLLVLFPLLSGITAAQNRPYGWTAWLHYGRHMTLVNQSGESLREIELTLPDGYIVINRTPVAMSHNEHLVAYLARISEQDGQDIALLVYDLDNGDLVLNHPYTIETPIDNVEFLKPEAPIFNETDTTVAFVNTDTFAARNYVWEISTIDLKSGQVESTLKSDDKSVIAAGIDGETWHVFPRSFQNAEIAFTVESFVDMSTESRSYVWDTMNQHFRETTLYPSPSVDEFYPTHEIVMTARDNRLDTEGSYCYSENTLQIYDPIIRGRFPFQLMLGYPKFVQNGERVLAQGCYMIWNHEHLTLIERDGTIVDEWNFPESIILQDIKNIPDGFLYTADLSSSANPAQQITAPALFVVNTRNDKLDAGQAVWYLSFKEFRQRAQVDFPQLDIVWVHSDAPVSAYIPWAQLAPPVYEPTPIAPENLPQPTMLPTPEPLFQVGMTVTVQTTGGEILNLRVDHTRKAEVIMYLEDDMQLTLLEGPIEAEGYTWWRIRTEDDIEGWTVENNGELQTLIPN